MTVAVNGEARDVPDGSTIVDLLNELGLTNQACAVEVNRSLVPKARHGSRTLAEGDSIEVVTLVGGG